MSHHFKKMIEQLSVDKTDKILVIGVDSVNILAALSNKYKEVASNTTNH